MVIHGFLQTIRADLSITEDLLLKPSLSNMKVIYQVRDPRAVLHSRWDWRQNFEIRVYNVT